MKLSDCHFIDLSTNLHFFDLFKIIESRYETCFLLESLGEYGKVDQYSVIGFGPDQILTARDQTLNINGKKHTVLNPYSELNTFLKRSAHSYQHFTGGLVGYLGFDAVNYFEPQLKLKTHPDFDQFMFGYYSDGIVFDKQTKKTIYFYRHQNRYGEINQVLTNKIPTNSVRVQKQKEGLSEDQHAQKVEAILNEVKAGNTFQCQLGFKKKYHITGSPLTLYEKVRQVNPSPHMFYLKFNDKTLMGASPELLFRMQSNQMETFPLAGTIRRGKTTEEDTLLGNQLLTDPKEIAEHNMLIDLHRNDLGRVAQFGSVKIRKLKELKKFSHVQHISSEIIGDLGSKHDMFSALASNFPAGTLSGAPKVESIKIIDQIEDEPRGPYGGAIGYFGVDGNCSFSIPIRSLFISGELGFTQASGGIVYDSQASAEYQEIHQKLKAFDVVLSSFEEIL